MKEFRVSGSTDPKKLAGTVRYYLGKDFSCVLSAMGQKSICVAAKSVAMLGSMFDLEYSCTISYFDYKDGDELVSGIKFIVM